MRASGTGPSPARCRRTHDAGARIVPRGPAEGRSSGTGRRSGRVVSTRRGRAGSSLLWLTIRSHRPCRGSAFAGVVGGCEGAVCGPGGRQTTARRRAAACRRRGIGVGESARAGRGASDPAPPGVGAVPNVSRSAPGFGGSDRVTSSQSTAPTCRDQAGHEPWFSRHGSLGAGSMAEAEDGPLARSIPCRGRGRGTLEGRLDRGAAWARFGSCSRKRALRAGEPADAGAGSCCQSACSLPTISPGLPSSPETNPRPRGERRRGVRSASSGSIRCPPLHRLPGRAAAG